MVHILECMSQTTIILPTVADLMAGRAVLTVDNGRGEHVTFRIAAPAKGNKIDRSASIRFVSIMTGSDNEVHYTYAGLLDLTFGIRRTTGSKMPHGDRRMTIAAWAIRQCVNGNVLPEGYQIRHSGCCLRCGRTLTNPESLDVMYGPECAGKM